MKARWLIAAVALLVAGCGQADDPQEASDLTETPDVSPTAAPGVAFRYFYRFELPDEAIASVQGKHAARCESLGVSRCRITGLNYSVNADDAVSASLEVKLAPQIARQFGKQATTDVKDANGQLRSTEFTGVDTEPTTTQATRQQSDLQTRISDIERQLATASDGEERAQLQSQLNELRSQLSQAQATIVGAEQQLASTPMTFTYYGRGGISGFRTNPVREAARLFVSSLVTMITFVLRALALLLPWAALVALIVLIARSRFGRAVGRLFTSKRGEEEEHE